MQTSAFSFFELLLYIIPVMMSIFMKKYGRPYFNYFDHWPMTLAICLIPTLFVLIYDFGWLIFGFNTLPYILLFSSFTIGLFLYKYIQTIERFSFRAFYLPASEVLFLTLIFHLAGMIILRWWSLIK